MVPTWGCNVCVAVDILDELIESKWKVLNVPHSPPLLLWGRHIRIKSSNKSLVWIRPWTKQPPRNLSQPYQKPWTDLNCSAQLYYRFYCVNQMKTDLNCSAFYCTKRFGLSDGWGEKKIACKQFPKIFVIIFTIIKGQKLSIPSPPRLFLQRNFTPPLVKLV